MKKELIICLVFVLFLYPISASNMYNYVYNGSSWIPALATADGQQKYWIDMANATYGNVVSNLTVGESILVSGNLNVTGVSYLGDLTFDAENVTFKGGGDMYASGGSIFYNNGSETIDLRVRNIPENAVMSFNLASCPSGWTLADGTSGTPDLRGIFVRGAGVSGSMLMANGTNFSATYGEYGNDSMQQITGGARFRNLQDANLVILSSDIYGAFDIEYTSTTTTIGASASGTTQQPQRLLFDSATSTAQGGARTGAETAPASYALIYCVKTAEDSATSNSIWQTIGDLITPVNSSKDFAINNSDFYVNVTSGNVGIGTGSPEYVLDVNGAGSGIFQAIRTYSDTTTDSSSLFFMRSHSDTFGSMSTTQDTELLGLLRFYGVDANNDYREATAIYNVQDGNAGASNVPGAMTFRTNNTERMRITPSGNVGIGTSSPEVKLDVYDINTGGYVAYFRNAGGGVNNHGIKIRAGDSGAGTTAILAEFTRNDDTNLGEIIKNGASSVAYSTSSDRRLKDIDGNLKNEVDVIDLLKNLNPVYGNFKEEKDIKRGMFIAQDVELFIPDIVTGSENENRTIIDDEGNEKTVPKYLGLDYGKLTPYLWAISQKQQELIEGKQIEIDALKEIICRRLGEGC
ncbi:MAG: hypothetical protein ABFQ65_03470 [Nanoarchaeota archaeon]